MEDLNVSGWYHYGHKEAMIGYQFGYDHSLITLLHELWHGVQDKDQAFPETMAQAEYWDYIYHSDDVAAATVVAFSDIYDEEERWVEYQAELMARDFARYEYRWAAWILRKI